MGEFLRKHSYSDRPQMSVVPIGGGALPSLGAGMVDVPFSYLYGASGQFSYPIWGNVDELKHFSYRY